MKKLLLSLILTLSASAAFAESITTSITLTPNAVTAGSYSGSFGATHQFSGFFTDSISILPELSGDISSSIITIGFLTSSNIDFNTVSINGQLFNLSGVGAIEFGSLTPTALHAPLVLTVTGFAGAGLPDGTPIAASYSGTLNLDHAYSDVPEPATAALLGLALFGFGVARRRRQ